MYLDNKRRDRKNGDIDARRGAEAGMLDLTEVSLAVVANALASTDLSSLRTRTSVMCCERLVRTQRGVGGMNSTAPVIGT